MQDGRIYRNAGPDIASLVRATNVTGGQSRSATGMVADALLPLQQRLINANQFHGTAMRALERTRFKAVELIDRLQLAARAAAIALEMIRANIVIAVPTMRHPETSAGIGALVAAIKNEKS